MAKDDPNPHAMCMDHGHLYYAAAEIAPGVGSKSPWPKPCLPDRPTGRTFAQLPPVI
jgi:hypothetical protein